MDYSSPNPSVPISSDRLVWLLCTADSSTDTYGTTVPLSSNPSSATVGSIWSNISSYLWGSGSTNNTLHSNAPQSSTVSTPSRTTDTTDEIRRLYQRFSLPIQRLSPPLKAILIVQLAARAVKSGAPIHRIMENNPSANMTTTSITALQNSYPSSSSVVSRSASLSSTASASPSPKMINVSVTHATTFSANPSSSVLGIHTDVGIIANILLSTYSTELSELKRFIDCPYVYTLSQATVYEQQSTVVTPTSTVPIPKDATTTKSLFPSIQSLPLPTEYIDLVTVFSLLPPSLRAHVAHHIRTEATKAIQYWSTQTSTDTTRRNGVRFPVKIYSDFDDTVQARLFDRSFPYSTTYPGYLELIKGIRGEYDQSLIQSLPSVHNPNTVATDDKSIITPNVPSSSSFTNSVTDTPKGTKIPSTTTPPSELSSPTLTDSGIRTHVNDNITSFDGDETRPSIITDSIIENIENTKDNDVHAVLAEVAGLIGTELTPLPETVTTTVPSSTPLTEPTFAPPSIINNDLSPTNESIVNPLPDVSPALSLADLSTIPNPTSVTEVPKSRASSVSTPSRSVSPSPASANQKLPTPDKQLSTVVLRSNSIVGVRKTRVTVYSDLALGAWALEQNTLSSSSTPSASSLSFSNGGTGTPLHGLATPSGLGSVQRKPFDRSSFSNSSGTSNTPISTPPRNLQRALDEGNNSSTTYVVPTVSEASFDHQNARLHDTYGTIVRADLIFLSARPGFLRSQTLTLANSIGLDFASILCGTLTAALNHSLMAARKLANHMLHSSLFPEFRTLFIGDSGQADIEFSLQMIIAHRQLKAGILMREPDSPLATVPPPVALIHDICGTNQLPLTAQAQRARLRAKQVHMFDSYIDAASLCYREGLLTPQALLRIVDHTTTALAHINFGTGSERQRISRLQEYQLAVRRVQYILNQDGYSHILTKITEHSTNNNNIHSSNDSNKGTGTDGTTIVIPSLSSESFNRIHQVTNTIITKHQDDSDDEKESKHAISSNAALGPGGFGYM